MSFGDARSTKGLMSHPVGTAIASTDVRSGC